MSDKKGSSEKLLYCSFCGKSQHEVKKLIAGPSVFICDECIDLCNDILQNEGGAPREVRTGAPLAGEPARAKSSTAIHARSGKVSATQRAVEIGESSESRVRLDFSRGAS